MQQRVLIATALAYRRRWYLDVLKPPRFQVETAASGIECVALIPRFRPEVLLLESYLLWGGCDGVLAVCEDEKLLKSMSVIVVDVRNDSDQTYRIGAYPLADYWRRYPTAEELRDTLQGVGALIVAGSV